MYNHQYTKPRAEHLGGRGARGTLLCPHLRLPLRKLCVDEHRIVLEWRQLPDEFHRRVAFWAVAREVVLLGDVWGGVRLRLQLAPVDPFKPTLRPHALVAAQGATGKIRRVYPSETRHE